MQKWQLCPKHANFTLILKMLLSAQLLSILMIPMSMLQMDEKAELLHES
jgi:hypothetical protein